MSKTSIKSRRASLRRAAGKPKAIEKPTMKPYGFCCPMDENDPLSAYDQRLPPAKSSLERLSVHECPTLRIFTHEVSKRRANLKIRDNLSNSSKNDILSLGKNRGNQNGPGTAWFLEDECNLVNSMLNRGRHEKYERIMDKSVAYGEAHDIKHVRDYMPPPNPYWYQDFSLSQMETVNQLELAIVADIEEEGVKQTSNALARLGVISSFVKIDAKILKRLINTCNKNPIILLYEIYKIVTGNFFDQEEYKMKYTCNERIILSAISFLTLPSVVVELNRRLPSFHKIPRPRKPAYPTIHRLQKRVSPYLTLVDRAPNWQLYENKMMQWEAIMQTFPNPSLILPKMPVGAPLNISDIFKQNSEDRMKVKGDASAINHKKVSQRKISKRLTKDGSSANFSVSQTKLTCESNSQSQISQLNIKSLSESTQKNITAFSDGSEGKNLFVAKPNFPKKPKSWLGEKDTHYVLAGTVDTCEKPSSVYVLDNIAQISPVNSDEEFFAKLDYKKSKTFPRGRENLSLKWQDWLINLEHDFLKVGNEADNLLSNIEEMAKTFNFPDPTCDPCCSCRQTRRSNLKFHATKTPRMVIEAVVSDLKGSSQVIGSLMMHSPPPSREGSLTEFTRVIPSKHEIIKKIIVNGVEGPDGNTERHVTGVSKEEHYTPSRVETIVTEANELREVPSCKCAVEKIFNEGVSPTPSDLEVTWNDEKNVCFGHKYRPDAGPAYSCCGHPTDKTCKAQRKIKQNLEDYLKRMRGNCEKQREEYDPLARGSFPKFTKPVFKTSEKSVANVDPWRPDIPLNSEDQARREEQMKQLLEAPSLKDSEGNKIPSGLQSARTASDTRFVKKEKVEEDNEKTSSSEFGNESSEPVSSKVYRICTVSDPDDAKKSMSHTISESNYSKTKVKSLKSNTALRKLKSQMSFVMEKSELNASAFLTTRELAKLLQVEIQRMADEGILFAKLPDVFKMPQLQSWIIYRTKGRPYRLNKSLKDASVRIAKNSWEIVDRAPPTLARAKTLTSVTRGRTNITYDYVLKLKRRIALAESRFYSKVRRKRVENSRMMWATMDFGTFPNLSFKRAYFTYLPGKEADGYVYNPHISS